MSPLCAADLALSALSEASSAACLATLFALVMAVSLGYLTAADSAISLLAFARSAALVASLTS